MSGPATSSGPPALAVGLVLFTAVGNASALVLQRKAAQECARDSDGADATLREVTGRPAWRIGIAVFAAAVAVQATALALGSIALVQPVLVMALPFTLLLGRAVLGGVIRPSDWVAVAVMSVGLVVLLVSLRPRGGAALAQGDVVWAVGAAATLAVIGGCCAVAARRHRPPARAGWYGVAAGFGSGFVAVLFSAVTEALVAGGPMAALSTWQTSLLVPTAPLAFLALQAALRAGRLIASQPGLVLGNPLLASAWGVGLLGEQVNGGAWLLGGLVGALLLTAGVFLLARSPSLAAQDAGPRRVPVAIEP